MNTTNGKTPILKAGEDYVFFLEFIEPAMSVEKLDEVIELFNQGMEPEKIAELQNRQPLEILVGLLHQVYAPRGYKKGNVNVTRPFAYRNVKKRNKEEIA